MSEPTKKPHDGDPPGLGALFLAFSGIAIMGFGGVLPWARRMLVEERRWMSDQEFAELLALCQFLPGGNVINLAIVAGQRMRGLAGSIVCVTALMAAPVVIVLLLGALYLRYAHLPEVMHALDGIAAAAAGLVVAMAAKMARPLLRKSAAVALAFVAATFVGVAIFRFSLPLVVLVLAPFSIAASWPRASA